MGRSNLVYNETIMKSRRTSGALALALAIAGLPTGLSATATKSASTTISPVMSASASTAQATVTNAFDGDLTTAWSLDAQTLKQPQWLMLTIGNPGDVQTLTLNQKGASAEQLKRALDIYVTYDPMNLGTPVEFTATTAKDGTATIKFPAKYGAHVRVAIKPGIITKPWSLAEMTVGITAQENTVDDSGIDRSYLDTSLPIDRRIEILLAQMTPQEKMELIREGWGIPGVPRLGIPDIKKVEAIHGYSYGTGATMFPQVLGMAARAKVCSPPLNISVHMAPPSAVATVTMWVSMNEKCARYTLYHSVTYSAIANHNRS